jgi:hypothetical protein
MLAEVVQVVLLGTTLAEVGALESLVLRVLLLLLGLAVMVFLHQ